MSEGLRPDWFVFYVIQNHEGKILESRSGFKVYTNLAQARHKVTSFANENPTLPLLKILKLTVGSIEVLDEDARVKKAQSRRHRLQEQQKLRESHHRLQRAQQDLKKAQEDILRESQRLKDLS